MSDEKAEAELKRLIYENEDWISKYGAVTPRTHNAFLSNIYGNFPCIKYVEYFVPKDDAIQEVQMLLYIDVLEWLTGSQAIEKIKKFFPMLNLVKNKKLEELLDVLPYVDMEFIKQKREFLVDGIRSLADRALQDYKINITIKRWKPGVPKAQ